jgi:hypothetical protein
MHVFIYLKKKCTVRQRIEIHHWPENFTYVFNWNNLQDASFSCSIPFFWSTESLSIKFYFFFGSIIFFNVILRLKTFTCKLRFHFRPPFWYTTCKISCVPGNSLITYYVSLRVYKFSMHHAVWLWFVFIVSNAAIVNKQNN